MKAVDAIAYRTTSPVGAMKLEIVHWKLYDVAYDLADRIGEHKHSL